MSNPSSLLLIYFSTQSTPFKQVPLSQTCKIELKVLMNPLKGNMRINGPQMLRCRLSAFGNTILAVKSKLNSLLFHQELSAMSLPYKIKLHPYS
jgi:hypothetical protein